jgi:hypothetical protein
VLLAQKHSLMISLLPNIKPDAFIKNTMDELEEKLRDTLLKYLPIEGDETLITHVRYENLVEELMSLIKENTK